MSYSKSKLKCVPFNANISKPVMKTQWVSVDQHIEISWKKRIVLEPHKQCYLPWCFYIIKINKVLHKNLSGHLKPTSVCLPFLSSRFGKKKDEKTKDAAKASKSKLEALSEEELDRNQDNRDRYGSDVGGVLLCVGFSQSGVLKATEDRIQKVHTREAHLLCRTAYLTSCCS